MKKTENAILITSTLIDARNTLKRLNDPDTYAQKIAQNTDYIRRGAIKWKCSELESAMKILDLVKESPYSMLGIMAALVEMESAP